MPIVQLFIAAAAGGCRPGWRAPPNHAPVIPSGRPLDARNLISALI
jgi:hypothetical protein